MYANLRNDNCDESEIKDFNKRRKESENSIWFYSRTTYITTIYKTILKAYWGSLNDSVYFQCNLQ